MHVAVAIATYRRPAGLERLLEGLLAQVWDRMPAPRISVLVVENDEAGVARELCAEARWGALDLRYAVEPSPGIAFARNRCLDLALACGADWFAFIDDDEVPAPTWLEELMLEQKRSCASVVAGRVLPAYRTPPPGWVARGRFHEDGASVEWPVWRRAAASLFRSSAPSTDFPSGTALTGAATNNVLFCAELVRGGGLRFDETLASFGYGEDSLFFLKASRAGYLISWSSEAIVYHQIPQDRVSLGWLLRSAFQTGVCSALIASRLEAGTKLFAKAVARVVGNGALLPLAPFRGRHAVALTLMDLARGTGAIAGSLGLRLRFDRRLPPDKARDPVPVFVISLKGSARLEALLAELRRQGVPYEVLDAIDGALLDGEELVQLHDAKLARRRLGRAMGRGEIGCALSHRLAYAAIVQRGFCSAIILEEDAVLAPDFRHFWRRAGQLPLSSGLISLYAENGHARARPTMNMGDFTLHRAVTPVSSTAGYWLTADRAAALHAATARISMVADWPLDRRSLDHHVALPMPVGHRVAGSAIADERVRCEAEASAIASLRSRPLRAALFLSFLAYALERDRYSGVGDYIEREIAPRTWLRLDFRRIKLPSTFE